MNALRFEWIKFRSLRGSWLMVGATVLAGLALSVLGVSDLLDVSTADLPAGWDPTATSMQGFLFAQLLIGMAGALAVTPEFASGVIGSSLAVVPSRTRLLAAKTAVVGGVVGVTAMVTTLLSFGVVQGVLGASGLPAASLGDPDVLGALVGGTVYLSAIGVGGLAVARAGPRPGRRRRHGRGLLARDSSSVGLRHGTHPGHSAGRHGGGPSPRAGVCGGPGRLRHLPAARYLRVTTVCAEWLRASVAICSPPVREHPPRTPEQPVQLCAQLGQQLGGEAMAAGLVHRASAPAAATRRKGRPSWTDPSRG
jgi:hypothetical protein